MEPQNTLAEKNHYSGLVVFKMHFPESWGSAIGHQGFCKQIECNDGVGREVVHCHCQATLFLTNKSHVHTLGYEVKFLQDSINLAFCELAI